MQRTPFARQARTNPSAPGSSGATVAVTMLSANARYYSYSAGTGGRTPAPGVCAAGLVGEVGAVEVRAQDAGAIRSVRLQPLAQAEECEMLLVAGHGCGRQEARGAVAGVGATGGAKRLLGPVHEVGPVPPVDVEVDEPGCEIATPQVDLGLVVALRLRSRPDRGNPRPVHLDPCPREQPIFEDDGAAVEDKRPHTSFTRFRVLRSKPTGRTRRGQ